MTDTPAPTTEAGQVFESRGESHDDEELVACGFCGWDETVSESHAEDCGR